ncbi:MAG: molybdopterin-dependent oxidoreductase [Rhodanobacteraceae bacterium]
MSHEDDRRDKRGIDRRRFLIRGATAAGGLLLGGCDMLSNNKTFTRLLGSAADLNERIQPALASRQALAREFSESDISAYFKSNGTHYPSDPEYQRLAANHFTDWRLEVNGLVAHPQRLSLDEVRALPSRTQITRHDCVDGWSCIGKWQGARLSALLERVKPSPAARFVVFYCYDTLHGGKYYESIDMDDAFHPQTILAYRFDNLTLPIPHGAPLRLRLPRQLGYKMAKYLKRIELVKDFGDIRGGNGGFWEDRGYAWYAGI